MGSAFQQGERVIVPLHGRGVVRAVQHLPLPDGGEETCYVVDLEGRRGGRVVIPASRVAEHGLRPPMTSGEVESVLAVLSEPMREETEAEQPSQPDLYKGLKVDLRAGSAESLARVVRRLYIFSLTAAITDVHLRELERYAWSELVDELAQAELSTKTVAQRSIRSALRKATPQEMLR